MAKVKSVEEAKPEFIEVEYVLGDIQMTIYIANTSVQFVDGKAMVTPEVADALKEAALIK